MNWNNILERAGWTFAQGFVTVLVAAPALDATLLEAAVAAGAMAVLSFLKTVIQSKLAE